jgi:hypothetical protein
MVHLYNKYSGGVDRRNSLVALYRPKFVREKWYLSVFDRILETAIANAYTLFKNKYNTFKSRRNTGIYKVSII